MAKVQVIGPYSAYAIAVKYGYKGTEEEWVKEQEANRKAAEAAAAAAAESAKQAAASAEQAAGAAANVDNAKNSAVEAVKNEGTAQQSAVASAGNSAVQAVKDEGAAQTSALDDAAAAHKTELDSIASHPPQPNTETGKWQVWNAETGAYQDTDALYQGGYYTASVSDDGTLTWQGSQEGMPELPSVNIKGPKGDKGDPGLGVPTPTTSDAGKVPVVNAEGTGYELGDPQVDAYSKSESDARYAPIAAAIRPTASGNPVNITDSVEWPLLGLKVYGKSTQDGAPSPESPVPIVSAGEGGSIALTISDGAEQSQSLTLSTPNGLPGIPVDSGGNYTDASGQQWASDEVNDSKRVYRIEQIEFDGSPDESWAMSFSEDAQRNYFRIRLEKMALRNKGNNVLICSSYLYYSYGYAEPNANNTVCFTSNNLDFACTTSSFTSLEEWREYLGKNKVSLIYAVSEPIETPLSPEEIAAYRALHTYDGATVISTPEDVAGLEVKYVADAQKYIDDRLAAAESRIQEIATAQLNAQTGG